MKKKAITILILSAVVMTGCEERTVNATHSPIWADFNACKEDAHVYFAYSDDSFYSDGSLNSELLYKEFEEERKHEKD